LLCPQKFLHQKIAAAEINPASVADQFLPQGADQVGFTATRIAEDQDILLVHQKRAGTKGLDLIDHLARQAGQVKLCQALFQGQLGFLEQSLDAFLLPDFTFPSRHLQEILLIMKPCLSVWPPAAALRLLSSRALSSAQAISSLTKTNKGGQFSVGAGGHFSVGIFNRMPFLEFCQHIR